MGRCELKVPGGKLLRVDCAVEGHRLAAVKLSGDFFLHPEESITILEERLRGVEAEERKLKEVVEGFIGEGRILIGLEPG
ncbi:MAG: lipoate protein ligase C-terminal domain-containing protein, partial [Candidatus Bathyarchaeia archaeon]